MLPLRLELEGFLTYRDFTPLDFRDDWLWAITGKNGAGKSALFDAMTFVLYGQYRGGAKAVERLMSHGCDFTCVTFDFAVGSDAFQVQRTIARRRGRTTITHPKTRAARRIEWSSPPAVLQTFPTPTDAALEAWVVEQTGLTYDAFLACVLLNQGDATRFISAPPAGRREVLMHLLDLREYERLADAAKGRHDLLQGELRAVTTTLAALGDPSPEEKLLADAAVVAVSDELVHLETDIERQIGLKERASEFANMRAQLAERERALAAAQELVADGQRIDADAAEHAAIGAALPRLRTILAHQTEAGVARGEEARARACAAGLDVERLASHAEMLQSAALVAAEALQTASAAMAAAKNSADALQPAADAAREVGSLVAEITSGTHELAGLQAHVEARVQLKADVLAREDAAVLLPLVRGIAAARADARQAIQERDEHVDALAQLRPQLGTLRASANELESEEASTHEKAVTVRLAHTRAVTALEHARMDLAARIAAGEEGRCSRCGQQVDSVHLARERAELERQITDLKREAADADEQASSLETNEAALRARRNSVGREAAEMEVLVGRTEATRDQCDRRAKEAGDRASADAARLPASEAARLGGTDGYPSPADLVGLEELANGLVVARARLTEADAAAESASSLRGRLAALRRRLEELRARFPEKVLRSAVERHASLVATAEQLTQENKSADEAVHHARRAATEAAEAVATAREECLVFLDEAREHESCAREAEAAVAVLGATLDPRWDAISLATEGLRGAIAEREGRLAAIAEAPEQKVALDAARLSMDMLKSEVRALELKLAQVPPEYRVPAAEIESTLAEFKARRMERQEHQRQLVADAARLAEAFERAQRQRLQRDTLQKQVEDAALLQRWFGKDGLQAVLVQEAQVQIGLIANDYLSSISEGWLGLVFEPSKDALEIRVTDLSSGDEAIDVALLSGSQKFRVAVSVALAIGQYRGGCSRDIWSVIIDEGFGSLDRDGRREIIEQLRGLGNVLERVILVSHQEEFQEAFSNGYHVEKTGRVSSVVRRGTGSPTPALLAGAV